MARRSVTKNELVVILNGKLTTGVVVSSWVDSTGRSNEMRRVGFDSIAHINSGGVA